MPAKEELFDTLGQQKAHREQSTPDILREWKASLESLFMRFQGWLQEPNEKGLLDVKAAEARIVEPALGIYLVPSLSIVTPRGLVVDIRPKARVIAGADGRVDFECVPQKIALLRRAPSTWHFARLVGGTRGWALTELNEESFWAAMQELIS